jgi:PKD repeat protein
LAGARAQTAFLDFNTVGQYTNSFNTWNDSNGINGGNYSFEENPTVGVGGSGGVSVFQNTDTTATYTNISWDFSASGATVTVSLLIQANGQVSVNKVQLGILNTNDNGLNNNGGVAFESFRFIPATGTSWTLYEQHRSGGTLPPQTTLGTVSTIVGEWYKFVVTLTNVGGAAGNFNAACAIYDYGTDGLTPGTNIVTFPTVVSQTGLTDLTVPAIWPALRAFQNGGINAWDDFLVFTPASLPVITRTLTNTSVAAGQSASFATLADGPGTISLAWYTNGTLASGATGATYTTPPVNAQYTNIMVVATNGNGKTTNSASIVVFIPSAASVTNQPATGILTTSATLNGQVLSTGGVAPTVTVFYGTADGGANAAAWSNSLTLGTQSSSFAPTVTGLMPNTTYYFTARAVNSVGTSWAAPSLSFTTLPVNLATVTNLPATGVQATTATLNGQVLTTGNDSPTVTLYYGTADGGSNPGAWAQSVSLGVQAAAFSQVISGLSSNTTYYFTAEAINAAGPAWATPSATFTTLATNPPLPDAVAVLTQHNDNGRTGMNLLETILNTNNVNTNQFGLVYSRPVDDQIYAQPLIMTNVSIVGKGVHNLVIVATVNDSVYAYDADDASVTAPYWQKSFLGPNARAPRNTDMTGACGGNYQDFSGNIGIVGTPVIDPVTGTIYLVARTLENGTTFVQRLHALDISTGSDRTNAAVITATYAGTGDGSVGGIISFDPQRANQRPALSLVNGVVYIAWSSHCDWSPYHGWIIGYDSKTLQQLFVFNDTPNGSQAGIWMSNQGLASDTNGNLYLSTGNGSVDAGGGPNRGQSFLKLTPSGTNLNVASWFTPYNWQALNNGDLDLGSGGVLLIPGTSLAFGGGKQGFVYLVNRDNMGGLSSGTSDTNVVQSFQVTSDQVHTGPIWWNGPGGPFGYIWPASVSLQQYRFNGASGKFTLPALAQSPTAAPSGQPGGLLALSANGTNAGSGIVWATHQFTGDANQSVRPGILHAYDAANVSHELWNSQQNSARDAVGSFAKFVPPTVANGKVYLATFSGQLDVYGVLPSSSPAQLIVSPTSLNFGSVFAGQSSNQVFQVVNNGGLTLTGAVSTTLPFKISAGSPFSLNSGQTGQVQVAFSPTTAGSFSNVVVFLSNGGNSTNVLLGSAAATPAADFTASPTIGTWPLAVLFNDTSTGTITNRSWDFGDNSTTNTTQTSLTHSYAGPGTNTVRLTVSGPVGTNILSRPGYIVVTNLGPVTLSILTVGQQLQLSWPAGTLQWALQATGPFTNLPAATSPYFITPSNAAQFFRIKVR